MEKSPLEPQKLLENFLANAFTAAAVPRRLQRPIGAPTPKDIAKRQRAVTVRPSQWAGPHGGDRCTLTRRKALKIQPRYFSQSSLKSKNFLSRKFLVGHGAKPRNSRRTQPSGQCAGLHLPGGRRGETFEKSSPTPPQNLS